MNEILEIPHAHFGELIFIDQGHTCAKYIFSTVGNQKGPHVTAPHHQKLDYLGDLTPTQEAMVTVQMVVESQLFQVDNYSWLTYRNRAKSTLAFYFSI